MDDTARFILCSSTPADDGIAKVMDPCASRWYLIDALVDAQTKERLYILDAESEATGKRMAKLEVRVLRKTILGEQQALPLPHYRPSSAWFARSPYGIHGVGHVTRVMVWVDVLCQCLGSRVNRDAVLWAAALHDIGRTHDGRCSEHGQRAVDILQDNRGVWEIPEADYDLIAHLVTSHCQDDSTPCLELQVLKDADALDRARLGDLNPRFLRLPESHQFIHRAEVLYWRTSSITSRFWDVIRAAAEMGIWQQNV